MGRHACRCCNYILCQPRHSPTQPPPPKQPKPIWGAQPLSGEHVHASASTVVEIGNGMRAAWLAALGNAATILGKVFQVSFQRTHTRPPIIYGRDQFGSNLPDLCTSLCSCQTLAAPKLPFCHQILTKCKFLVNHRRSIGEIHSPQMLAI